MIQYLLESQHNKRYDSFSFSAFLNCAKKWLTALTLGTAYLSHSLLNSCRLSSMFFSQSMASCFRESFVQCNFTPVIITPSLVVYKYNRRILRTWIFWHRDHTVCYPRTILELCLLVHFRSDPSLHFRLTVYAQM